MLSKPLKYTVFYSLYLIVVWTAYRLSGIVISQEIDEFVVKPIVWLGPILLILFLEKEKLSSLGFTFKNLYAGFYLALILGLVYAIETVLVNFIKYGSLSVGQNLGSQPFLISMGIALGTAVVEEVSFRGYIFSRFLGYFKNEIVAMLITSLLWVVIHIPATLAVLGYNMHDAVGFWFLAFLYSMGACFVFAKTKNVFAVIFLFLLWEAPLLLFR